MYADAFELPPSQGPTPAKAGRGAAGKSPGKRTRATRHSAVAAEPAAEESPAKKQRRAPARR